MQATGLDDICRELREDGMRLYWLAAMALASLAACGKSPQRQESILADSSQSAPQNKFGFQEALENPSITARIARMAAPPPAMRATAVDLPQRANPQSAEPTANAIPVSLPKVAYTYGYGFRLDGNRIPELQTKHADLCEAQGPQICRIMGLRQSGQEDAQASGELRLQVISPKARGFGAELVRIASGAGSKTVESLISGEDLSKKIVDTEARLRTRETLRDRLMEVLATRKGTVAELIEAERGVAQVNEEIDQAKSWLAEMQGRVEFSDITIRYVSQEAVFQPTEQGNSFMTPVRAALGNVGAIIGFIIALLIMALSVVVPVGLIIWGLREVWLRLRDHLPLGLVYASRRTAPPMTNAELDAASKAASDT